MTEESIPLEGKQSKLFWVCLSALWILWCIEGLAALVSGEVSWLHWAKIAIAVTVLSVMGCTGIQRLRHGPMRVDFGEQLLTVRSGMLAPAISVPWSEITKVKFRTSGVDLHVGSAGRIVSISLNSYASVRAVKGRLGEESRERAIPVEGFE